MFSVHKYFLSSIGKKENVGDKRNRTVNYSKKIFTQYLMQRRHINTDKKRKREREGKKKFLLLSQTEWLFFVSTIASCDNHLSILLQVFFLSISHVIDRLKRINRSFFLSYQLRIWHIYKYIGIQNKTRSVFIRFTAKEEFFYRRYK